MRTPLQPDDWSRRRLWTFRIGMALFAVQVAVAIGDTSNEARAATAYVRNAVHAAFSAVWSTGVARLDRYAARSDGHAVVRDLLVETALAVAIAAGWTAIGRARRHDRLAGVLRMTLRYLVGTVMLIYGGLKVVPVQFPVPSAEELLRPLGERSSMALLWAFMGASPSYTVFAGLAEVLGGALLFWRRTTTLGALVLIGVLANVVMLNFTYDVPVKHGTALLFVAVLALASRDAGRLLRVLVLDPPTGSGGHAPFAAGPRLRLVRRIVKPTIVVRPGGGPSGGAVVRGAQHDGRGPLDGFYAVERFLRDGTEVAPLRTDPTRWWRVVIGDRGGVVVENASGRCERFRSSVDEHEHTLTLQPTDDRPTLRFRYELAANQLRLQGDGRTGLEVVLRPVPVGTVFGVLR